MEQKRKILIVEDEADINSLLCRILKGKYEVTSAFSGTEAVLLLEKEQPDLILLDLMIPGMTGEEVIKVVREKQNRKIPILVLSAKHALENKIETITAGADDYMTKPFEPEELLVRVMALLRRGQTGTEFEKQKKELTYKNIVLKTENRTAWVREKELVLTPHEYDILYMLIEHPQKIFSRETIYERIWKNGYYGEDNTVNVHVSNIRKKIAGLDTEEEYIKTVWGIGFKMA